VEERVEADLALGRHREVVGELAELVERHPLRERLRGQLMLALYRSGRQAEALEVYQEFRRALSEQLGLDPGPGLQQLEFAILGRDASLEVGTGTGTSQELVAGVSERPPGAVTRYGLGLAAGGVAFVALVVVAAVILLGGGAGRPSVIAADSVGAISPGGGQISADVPLGSSPASGAAGPGALWVSNYDAGTVSRIDPATHALVQTISSGETPSGIAVGAGAVWVANYIVGTVSRIDPTVNRVVQTIPVGNAPSGWPSASARCGSPTAVTARLHGSTRSPASRASRSRSAATQPTSRSVSAPSGSVTGQTGACCKSTRRRTG